MKYNIMIDRIFGVLWILQTMQFQNISQKTLMQMNYTITLPKFGRVQFKEFNKNSN